MLLMLMMMNRKDNSDDIVNDNENTVDDNDCFGYDINDNMILMRITMMILCISTLTLVDMPFCK